MCWDISKNNKSSMLNALLMKARITATAIAAAGNAAIRLRRSIRMALVCWSCGPSSGARYIPRVACVARLGIRTLHCEHDCVVWLVSSEELSLFPVEGAENVRRQLPQVVSRNQGDGAIASDVLVRPEA